MHTLADLIADEDQVAWPAADERRQCRALAENHLVGVAAQQPIGHPDRNAVDENGVGATDELVERTAQIVRFLDRVPVRGPFVAVTLDTPGHVSIARLRRRDESHASATGKLSDGETTLAATSPAENQMRRSHSPRILPRRPVMVVHARAGLLALGSSYS